MSELPADCVRFRDLVEEQIVDEAPARDVAWMREHTRTCEVCAAWQGGLTLVSSEADVPSVSQRRIDAIVDQAHGSQVPRLLYAAAVVVVVAGAAVSAAALLHRPAALVVVYGEVKADKVMSATAVIVVNERIEATLTRGTRFAVAPSRSHHTELRLQQGSARFSVRHRAGDEVIVATPQCDVIDEGTVFTVDAMADGTRIAVIEGAVEVKPRAGGVSQHVGAGLTVRVRDGAAEVEATGRDEPPLAVAPPTSPLPTSPAPIKTRAPELKAPSLDALLRTAQEARMHQAWPDAAIAYRRALTLHGDDPDAVVILVSLAQIELKHLREPEQSLSHFKAYIARNPHGALAAEALAGTAAAYRALGRTDDEARTLRELIASFPSDVNAQTAKERLDALQTK